MATGRYYKDHVANQSDEEESEETCIPVHPQSQQASQDPLRERDRNVVVQELPSVHHGSSIAQDTGMIICLLQQIGFLLR